MPIVSLLIEKFIPLCLSVLWAYSYSSGLEVHPTLFPPCLEPLSAPGWKLDKIYAPFYASSFISRQTVMQAKDRPSLVCLPTVYPGAHLLDPGATVVQPKCNRWHMEPNSPILGSPSPCPNPGSTSASSSMRTKEGENPSAATVVCAEGNPAADRQTALSLRYQCDYHGGNDRLAQQLRVNFKCLSLQLICSSVFVSQALDAFSR